MKNILLFLSLFFTPCCSVFSQLLIGLKSGVNFSKPRYYFDDEFSATFSNVACTEFGIISVMKIQKYVGIKAELNFLQKGGEVPDDFIIRANTVECALMTEFSVTSNNIFAYFGCGGSLDYVLESKSKDLAIGVETKIESSEYNKLGVDLLASSGMGLNIKKGCFFIEGRYRHPLTYFIDSQLEDFKISTKMVGFGLQFGYRHNIK